MCKPAVDLRYIYRLYTLQVCTTLWYLNAIFVQKTDPKSLCHSGTAIISRRSAYAYVNFRAAQIKRRSY